MKETKITSAYLGIEKTVLGAMLIDPVSVMDATSLLQVDDLQLDSHREIYRAVIGLVHDNERVDSIAVCNRLDTAKQLDYVGGPAYVAELTEGIPRNPNVESYVRMIREKSLLRQTLSICKQGVERAQHGGEGAVDLITDIEGKLASARAEVIQEATLESQVQKTIESIRRQLKGEQRSFIPSGVKSIDNSHEGYALGETTVIGARSNVGKSTMLRQATIENARKGNYCHIISPEMKSGLLLRMYASAESGVSFRRLRHPGWMTGDDHANVEAALREIASWPVKIDDTSPITPAEMIARGRIVKAKNNTMLFGVDYLQKLKYGGKVEHRHIHVTDAVVSLTSFAKNENVAVVLISSITEPQGKDRNKPPTMADLRQSGDIQFEADTVILIHRERDKDTQKHVPETQLIFDKGRADATGVSVVYFDSEHVRFVEQLEFLASLGK